MSTIRDRRKHQNRIEAIAEALDLNHNTTTNAPHAFASVGVFNADNATNSEGLSDDHAHIQAKDDSTNQHLDLHQGADGQTFCSGCNEIKDIFDFERGIPVKSWRTPYLLARFYSPYKNMAADRVRRISKNNIDKACSFCSFLMDCASRMAIHTAVDIEYDDWFLAVRLRFLEYRTREANSSYLYGSDINLLELGLFKKWDRLSFPCSNWHEDWQDTYVILPVQAYDDRHSEVSDTIDWELIKEWLDTCHAEHNNHYCNDLATTSRENIPSFCLIDCKAEMIIPAAEMNDPNYVTLSYVWGASITSPQVLDASTSLPVLPDSSQRLKVVNDAMEVVRRIGYRYLWVDRYCIPQGDHDAKSKQIKNMGKIYSLSVLTIIAAAGNDAEHGLPGVSSRPTLQTVWTTIHSGSRTMPVIYFEPPNKDILESTWNSRGWTYQEALLPKRRLVFTDRQVYFQCQSMQSIGLLDNDPELLLGGAMESQVFPFQIYEIDLGWEDSIWHRISDYIARTLSYEEDTIHAVQGVLESFRNKCEVWFFYGLPVIGPSTWNTCNYIYYISRPAGNFRTLSSHTQRILGSLLWQDFSRASTQNTRFSDETDLRKMGFPSWTWAGWETAYHAVLIRGGSGGSDLKYHVPEGLSFEIRVSYDDQCLAWSRDNQEIRRRAENIDQCPNFLIISGPVFDVSITCTDAEHQRTAGPPVWNYTSPWFLAIGASYVGPPYSTNAVGGNTMDLVALCTFDELYEPPLHLHALLLRPVDEDAHGQIYERVTCIYSEIPQDFKLADLNPRQMELRIR